MVRVMVRVRVRATRQAHGAVGVLGARRGQAASWAS